MLTIRPNNTEEIISGSVMSCLEHQRLTIRDFQHPEDFEYLIKQELPCFKIEVKRGEIVLLISHYLANIVLPSGINLEILPKTTVRDDDFINHQLKIAESRRWVAQMLSDIASDNLQRSISAFSINESPNNYSPNDYSPNNLSQIEASKFSQLIIPQNHNLSSQSSLIKDYKNNEHQPWYMGLLSTAAHKIGEAANVLPNQYKTKKQNTPKAQGKINLKSQLKNNLHRPHYFHSEHSVFDSNIELSQFLKTGWEQLKKLQGEQVDDKFEITAPNATELNLKNSNTMNSNISTSNITTPITLQSVKALPIRQWQEAYNDLMKYTNILRSQIMPRHFKIITEAIEWCWWLLNNMKKSLKSNSASSSTQLPMPALIINMNHAFERWVLGKLTLYVKNKLPGSRLVVHPNFDWLTTKDSLSDQKKSKKTVIQKLIPDACILDKNDKITHVIDIKYKLINAINEVTSGDWQQLTIYQKFLNCDNAWLIFPQSKNFVNRVDVCTDLNENRRPIKLGGTEMSAVPFSVTQGKLLIS